MCVIAGYTGSRQAAPILIDMMRKIEYIDGGNPTGIATIHEGKLYVAKAIGNVDMLVKMTDAMNLPGTTGIIHSRPGFDYLSTTHPYLDAEGKLAMVENGTQAGTGNDEFFAQMRSIMDAFLDRGIVAPTSRDIPAKDYPRQYTKDGKPFYYIEAFSMTVGDLVKDTPAEQMKEAMAKAVQRVHELLPTDNVTVTIHENLPDTITVGTISRPMSVMEAEGETYLASVALAFPEDVKGKVSHLPQCAVSQVTPAGLEICTREMDGVRVEQVTEEVLQYYRNQLEPLLKTAPYALCELEPILDKEIWSEPMVDCKYVREGSMLKPVVPAIYQALWSFHQEGRLRSNVDIVYARDVPWPNIDQYFTKFWLE